ncbi:DUF58 domain-containing protein [Fervidobacterium islandicum]|uniref:DUF58 domain-containing protein n=1 Tax=Fervidobacterium islandicum TaxID=2423 RepID=A0AAI8CLM9_FERIS|nr:DUF58 domain-containing protein [Fervidobacterium islandicum]AMW32728.1 DUF58 domain-containing protein [Fervidobacterium islandicum]
MKSTEKKENRRTWSKVSPAFYVIIILSVILSAFVYNKYVWLLDILSGWVIFDYLALKFHSKALKTDVAGRTRVFINERFDVVITISSESKKALTVEVVPPAVVKKAPVRLVINSNERVSLAFDTFFGTRGTKDLGYYTIKIESFTGLFQILITEPTPFKVKVFPRLEHAEAEVERILEMLPVVKSKHKLVEDISYIRNVREYEREPLNRIHWKQSAKMGELMVKEYEYVGTTRNYILLDLNLPAGIYSKAAWEFIHKKYQEEAIKATAGLLKYFSDRHEKTNLLISHAKGTYDLSFADYVLYFDYLAEVEGTLENEQYTSELLEHIIDVVQPTDTVLLIGMFLTKSEVDRLLRLRTRCGRVIVLIMPYGYREATSKKFKSYFDVPIEIRELYQYAKVLREENVIVQVWHENTSFMEGLLKLTDSAQI